MKLNMQNASDVLTYFENNMLIDDDGDEIEINFNEAIPNRQELAEIQDNEIIYIVHQLVSAGMLEQGKSYICDSKPRITGMTYLGHQAVAKLHEPKIIRMLQDGTISSLAAIIGLL